jgi:hypothetical protein
LNAKPMMVTKTITGNIMRADTIINSSFPEKLVNFF